jgi:hypothetical protein
VALTNLLTKVGATKVFVDIGGDRDLPALTAVVVRLQHAGVPWIFVKSEEMLESALAHLVAAHPPLGAARLENGGSLRAVPAEQVVVSGVRAGGNGVVAGRGDRTPGGHSAGNPPVRVMDGNGARDGVPVRADGEWEVEAHQAASAMVVEGVGDAVGELRHRRSCTPHMVVLPVCSTLAQEGRDNTAKGHFTLEAMGSATPAAGCNTAASEVGEMMPAGGVGSAEIRSRRADVLIAKKAVKAARKNLEPSKVLWRLALDQTNRSLC